ncbi:polyprenyl synthetase family protein [Ottowia thiooxydans]|uniref:polyprenyl synthetase family protein n=1 Tax=Ottowia thiooxydans TaxID=219182 RepID=UPI00041F99C8|nr:farnesyl diphosphate synthase [Ottowia thiooxydans]
MTFSSLDFDTWVGSQLALVEQALSQWVSADAPAGLGESMRYAVLDGGKRLRPLLVLAACEAAGGHGPAALRAACAVELIHAYSLVHDDMPCMDNDVLRRGKPTVHVQFGEALALLAGDALQALAFELLTPNDGSVPPAMQADLCRLLAGAAGGNGMAGGQAIDLASVGHALSEPELRAMHKLKTGRLLQASVLMGVACARQPIPPAAQAALAEYGGAIGLAFQVVDDILDVTADSSVLGKTAGKDAAAEKPTYVSLMGLANSEALADELLVQAQRALLESGLPGVSRLRSLAELVVKRKK